MNAPLLIPEKNSSIKTEIIFVTIFRSHALSLFEQLQDFILRARVLKLYRDALRAARRAPGHSRGELVEIL